MIWQTMLDHKFGNTFLRPIKDEKYSTVVKHPMSLDLIKHRIRDGTIKTTSEFHRDMFLMLANAIIYNEEDSDGIRVLMQFIERRWI